MLSALRNAPARRRWLANTADDGSLRQFYQTPGMDRSLDYRQAEFVALDLETTGLNAHTDEIVSVGWVLVRRGRVEYGESGHILVKPERALNGQSAVIHQITDDHLVGAATMDEALDRVLPILAGRVLIAHYCKIEWSFLNAACRRCFGAPLVIPTVDTMALEQRTARRRNLSVTPGGFRLDAIRKQYNLPRYRAHNAMIDAIATAELFLAQAEHRRANGRLALRDLLV